MTRDAERELTAEVLDRVRGLRGEVGYDPAPFLHAIATVGIVEACRADIRAERPSDAFNILWDIRRLDLSVEAMSLLPWYAVLFDHEDALLARQRLAAYRFDIGEFLRRCVANPPSWWGGGSLARPA